ncbi:Uncharacterized protein OBRU01_03948, partial [Operophtera brumata]
QFVYLDNGSKLLIINGYTYCKHYRLTGNETRYKCSRVMSMQCRAYAVVSDAGHIVSQSGDHNHEPSEYVMRPTGRHIKVGLVRGATLLVIGGHTFSKHTRNKVGGFRYKCSSNSKGCKAFAQVSSDDTIVKCNNWHNHEPIQFMQTADGLYIKLVRGATLLVIDGHTFSKHARNKVGGFRYKCSSNNKGCKAFAQVSSDDTIVKCQFIMLASGSTLLLLDVSLVPFGMAAPDTPVQAGLRLAVSLTRMSRRTTPCASSQIPIHRFGERKSAAYDGWLHVQQNQRNPKRRV